MQLKRRSLVQFFAIGQRHGVSAKYCKPFVERHDYVIAFIKRRRQYHAFFQILVFKIRIKLLDAIIAIDVYPAATAAVNQSKRLVQQLLFVVAVYLRILKP